MKKTETITLCILFLFSVIQGEDDLHSPTRLQNFTTPSTSSSPQRSSTAKPESLSRPTLLTDSSGGDLSVNQTHSYNVTAESTVTPGIIAGTDGPTVNSLAYINSTTVMGNRTDAQDESDRSVGNNQTSTLSSTNTTTTPLPGTITTTSAPSLSQSLSASTEPQITTRVLATTTQSRGNSTTVTTKDTASVSSTRVITTTTTTQIRDTPELNVGDDPELSATSMDPLLVGLVSVFVITGAVVSLLIFLKFRRRNERPEFRRLQDLPMDDMMEDTPLSMYSY